MFNITNDVARTNSAASTTAGILSRLDGFPCWTSRVIKTAKMINTEIAPTYISIWITAKNSALRSTNNPATPKNDTTRKRADLNMSRKWTTAMAARTLDAEITQKAMSVIKVVSDPVTTVSVSPIYYSVPRYSDVHADLLVSSQGLGLHVGRSLVSPVGA